MTLKLLLAGKDISSFQPIKMAFDLEDASTITATSVALAIFLARKNQPHLIISEQLLIDGDAIGFFYETRNEADLAKIPFAFFLKDKEAKMDIVKSLRHEDLENNIYFLFSDGELEDEDTAAAWKTKIMEILR